MSLIFVKKKSWFWNAKLESSNYANFLAFHVWYSNVEGHITIVPQWTSVTPPSTMTSPSAPNIRAPMTLPQINFKGGLQCLDFGFLKVKNRIFVTNELLVVSECFLISCQFFRENFIVVIQLKKNLSQLSSTYRSPRPFLYVVSNLRFIVQVGTSIETFLVSHDRDPISK